MIGARAVFFSAIIEFSFFTWRARETERERQRQRQRVERTAGNGSLMISLNLKLLSLDLLGCVNPEPVAAFKTLRMEGRG